MPRDGKKLTPIMRSLLRKGQILKEKGRLRNARGKEILKNAEENQDEHAGKSKRSRIESRSLPFLTLSPSTGG